MLLWLLKTDADVAICRNGQVDEQSNSAFGKVLPVLTDCHAALAMTRFFESRLHGIRPGNSIFKD
jgi:hypothetical protein